MTKVTASTHRPGTPVIIKATGQRVTATYAPRAGGFWINGGQQFIGVSKVRPAN